MIRDSTSLFRGIGFNTAANWNRFFHYLEILAYSLKGFRCKISMKKAWQRYSENIFQYNSYNFNYPYKKITFTRRYRRLSVFLWPIWVVAFRFNDSRGINFNKLNEKDDKLNSFFRDIDLKLLFSYYYSSWLVYSCKTVS